ncbi:alpha/beta hydrolase family protein [Wenzhouxiangella marina]|uniref:Dipeptidyl aminopeptidase/acylaminoacyl peptidase n=1 Tax=Wenzhouxiangella marina TaxID=1579979 RepID=A0A0K0XUU5_9GAMM|nr:S9 family peptidase [Wenzhouxiangella marina]AKS41391.1 Dipeptidyl aminopeptidase/acylaminoacyl peptidase [Wenzhouxiangella marina]MBB6086855.1 dipeptidyl aminopeptidase/acylaminoacyl peptidase [Wenzhouxiangella marina]
MSVSSPVRFRVLIGLLLLGLAFALSAEERLSARDLFGLQWASELQISPDGETIVYRRAINDILIDRTRYNLWIIDADGSDHRPLLSESGSASSPRFSPDGERLAWVAEADGRAQLFVHWLDGGQTALVSNLDATPSSIAWSPDGQWIAFVMQVPADKPSLATPPDRPEGAEWAPAVRVIDSVIYRFDGRGFLEPGFQHVFVVSAEGGSARQITSGDYDHHGPLAWMPDGQSLLFTSNRAEGWQYQLGQRDLHRVDVADGTMVQLTEREGMISSPTVSPDGRWIAFEYDDHQGRQYSESSLALVRPDGSDFRRLGVELDRSMSDPQWAADSDSLWFRFDDHGQRHVGEIDLDGDWEVRVSGLGGTAIGRPYLSGMFHVSDNRRIAYTAGTAQRPADVHVRIGREQRRLTDLNRNLLDHRELAEVHEINYRSSVDGTEIQGWYLTPPGFDPTQRYPMILEIHGGPHLAYGAEFSAEMQRYAAEGFVVFYDNHRGSSSYGRDFGMLLEYKYSSEEDFGDHMSGVDAMIELGFVDPERLFITGGSAGGIATAYAIGLTDRFRAAAVAKPVINWISKTLTGDYYPGQIERQFPGLPWEHFEHYWQRSPLSLVGNVTTPTLLITGENDYRTPMSETEQYYQALQLRRVDTVMIRVPEAAHGIASRPSHLIAKIDNILAWFQRYDAPNQLKPGDADSGE